MSDEITSQTAIHEHSHELVPRHSLIPFILLVACFAFWGLANNMTDVLVAQFKKAFSLNDLQSGLVQTAFYGAYFCLALPAAVFIRRYDYKTGVLLGLGLFALGGLLFYPASHSMLYEHFLIALFVLASGLSVLETSANPYVLTMGAPQTATRRLSLAQSFNPVGSVIGVLIGKLFILTGLDPATEEMRRTMPEEVLRSIQMSELQAVMGPYLVCAAVIILLWLFIFLYPMPSGRRSQNNGGAQRWQESVTKLYANKLFLRGVLGQFLYIGIQIGCWSYTIRYVLSQVGGTEAEASGYLLCSIILLAFSRFAFTLLMSVISPATILVLLASFGTLFTLVVIFVGGIPGIYSLVMISGCMSVMFPVIYGLSLADAGEELSLGGSCMIMAILGGAVLTALMGQISDSSTIELAFTVPLAGFVYLVYFGFYCRRGERFGSAIK